MPPMTHLTKLRAADRTGRTRATRALQWLFDNRRGALAGHLTTANALKRLPGWLSTEFQHARVPSELRLLDPKELDHIRDWDDDQKELIRVALRAANANGQQVHFSWHLHHGNTEMTTIVNPGPPGDVTITFLSPWARLKPVATNDLHVRVGPNDTH